MINILVEGNGSELTFWNNIINYNYSTYKKHIRVGRSLLLTTQCDILVKKYETCVKISTLPLTVLIQSAII